MCEILVAFEIDLPVARLINMVKILGYDERRY